MGLLLVSSSVASPTLVRMLLFASINYLLSSSSVLGGVLVQGQNNILCDKNNPNLCDTHERCTAWKLEGECIRNVEYMKEHCPVSCQNVKIKTEPPKECKDIHPRCDTWAKWGECEDNPSVMNKYCTKSCNVCDKVINDADDYDKKVCVDQHENCGFWASKGECMANPNYMHSNCAQSCGTCDKLFIQDMKKSIREKHGQNVASKVQAVQILDDDDVKDTTKNGYSSAVGSETDFSDISSKFDKATKQLITWTENVGTKQQVSGTQWKTTVERLKSMKHYVETDDRYRNLMASDDGLECTNKHELCAFWSTIGECKNNKAYMTTNCAPACQTCHLIDIDSRCPPLKDPKPALRPGDLNKMFERIVRTAPGNLTTIDDEDYKRHLEETQTPDYTVNVISRPSTSPATEVSAVLDKSLPPWVITFDNFMTEEECNEMIQLGYKENYERSADVGKMKADGTFDAYQNNGRTSENAWCSDYKGCRSKELPTKIHQRIADVLQIDPENSEDFQILKYEKGQFYQTHHDFIPHQKFRHCGPRILTFFIYLSDVTSGGGTNFPNLDITVNPKRGRALLWPSIYDSDPLKKDPRFMHQALPVEEGTKFAVNGWIHMYDYITPQKNACN